MNTWQIIPLRRLAKGFTNGTTAEQVDESDYMVTRIETISEGKINYTKVGFIDKKDARENYKLKKGDIILSHINSLEIVGNHALYDGVKEVYHGMNLIRIIPNSSVNPKFISYQLKALRAQGYFASIAKPAINQASIPTISLKSIPILYVDLETQDKITRFLDQKVARIDEAIAKKKKLITLLEEKRRYIIDTSFTRATETQRLKRVSEFINRGVSPDYDDDGEVIFVNQACIYWDGLKMESIKRAKKESHLPGTRGFLKKGDLLVNSTGTGTLGRAALFDIHNDSSYFADSHVTIIRPYTKKILPRYLQYHFRTTKFQDDIYTLCVSGSTNQIELSRERLRELEISITELEEQEKIVASLDEMQKQVSSAVNKTLESIELLEECKTSLISNAVTGGIKI